MKFLLIYLLFIVNIYANQIKGKVIHISDGDTIHILTTEKEKYKIRLNDIDAPESKQAFGNKSKENLKKYIYNKNVTIVYNTKDKYGRILGTVYLNNHDINLQQVKDGFAWVYKKYSKNIIYYKAEIDAQNKRKGLWQDKNPIEPWIYRKK
jgi:endonuclease YncB( thermonuclease family)